MFYPLAEVKLSPHYNTRPAHLDVSLLVIHNISLPPRFYGGNYIDDLFLGQLSNDAHPFFAHIEGLQVSAHACIRRDGRITQYVPFDKRAWHAGVSSFQGRTDCNDFSIGIELEGCDDMPYTPEQYKALVALSLFIQKQFPAISIGRIVGHNDIAFGRKTDPGFAFDWAGYRQALLAKYQCSLVEMEASL